MKSRDQETKEELELLEFNINTNLKIEIARIEGNLPETNKDDFLDWIKHKAIECGLGYHVEYYAYTEDHNDDIEVAFNVELNKIEENE